jgi:hypothetical protein
LDKNISYDGIFEAILEHYPNKSVVGFVNKLFGKNYPPDSRVERLSTESHTDGSEHRSDVLFRINDDMLHFEVQTANDGRMALRVIEYSFYAAFKSGTKFDGDTIVIDFPESVVIYLRSNENTPKELNVRLNLPGGKVADFEITAKLMVEIPLAELTTESMLALFPFRPMNYERSKNVPIDLNGLRTDVTAMAAELTRKVKNGEVDGMVADLAASSLKRIVKNVLVKANTEKKEAERIMEAVERDLFVIEPLVWEAKGRTEGRAEGIAEGEARGEARGRTETAREMFAAGLDYEFIRRITKLNPDVLEKLRAEVEASKPADDAS